MFKVEIRYQQIRAMYIFIPAISRHWSPHNQMVQPVRTMRTDSRVHAATLHMLTISRFLGI